MFYPHMKVIDGKIVDFHENEIVDVVEKQVELKIKKRKVLEILKNCLWIR